MIKLINSLNAVNLFGDDVLGYVDENEIVIVHKRQCSVAAKLKSNFGKHHFSQMGLPQGLGF